jgi:hypothetical protein
MSNVQKRLKVWTYLSRRLWVLLFIFWITVCLYPVNNGRVRSLILLVWGTLWIWAFCLCWKNRTARYCVIIASLIPGLICILPARDFNTDKLRVSFVSSLESYQGCMYYWGGENRIGIDCSGLIRKSLIMANLKRGFLTFNGGMVRNAIWLWWNDASARHMKCGYDGKTKLLFIATSINELDHSKLKPGDFAVTGDGSHCLAYIGENKWIQAEPGAGKVIIKPSPDDEMGWYTTKVHIMRWTQFE